MTGTSRGHLLGGRVRHDQPETGHRTGIEPVLLAASVPARQGDTVLEAGSGSGAALLCLAARVPEVRGVGVERDTELAALASRNAAANGWPNLAFSARDIETISGRFDHAMANPPWHAPTGSPSPQVPREAAKRADAALPRRWAGAMAGVLRHRGTMTLIMAAHALPAWLEATAAAGCGSGLVLPLWPRAGRSARLIILRVTKGGRGAFAIAPGMALHQADGTFTPEADSILRDGARLDALARTVANTSARERSSLVPEEAFP